MNINGHIEKSLARVILVVAVSLMVVGLLSCSKKNVKPPYLDEKEAYERAVKMIENKEYTEGRELLTEVINRDRTKTYAPLAQLKLAESYVKDDEVDLSIEEYRKFLSSYPDNRYAPNAQYQIAALTFSQIEGADRGYKAAESAIREFRKLAELYPRNPYRDVIELRLQKCRNVLAEHEFYVGKFWSHLRQPLGVLISSWRSTVILLPLMRSIITWRCHTRGLRTRTRPGSILIRPWR
ncbi:MAG: tetratricopeptide repeat protein [Magnetococcales bacterium]|nr:tetratricopeptide repeat protein [Nitrospirota bacterium]